MTSSTSPASLPASLERVVQRFQRVSDPKQKYELLLWFAKRMKEFPEAEKLSEYKVPGCASQVYVVASLQDGKLLYEGDSDSQLTKGLLAALVEGLNGLTPVDVIQLQPDFIQSTGLAVSLTPSRTNGFRNMFQTMQRRAIALIDEAT